MDYVKEWHPSEIVFTKFAHKHKFWALELKQKFLFPGELLVKIPPLNLLSIVLHMVNS